MAIKVAQCPIGQHSRGDIGCDVCLCFTDKYVVPITLASLTKRIPLDDKVYDVDLPQSRLTWHSNPRTPNFGPHSTECDLPFSMITIRLA